MTTNTDNKQQYALIVRDQAGKILTTIGTYRQGFTKHERMSPSIYALCASIFALVPLATQIDMIAWSSGTKVESAPVLLVAGKTERAGQLTYSVPPQPPEPRPDQGQQQQTELATKLEPEYLPTERDKALALLFEIGHLVYFSEHAKEKSATSEEAWQTYWRGQPDRWIAHQIEQCRPEYDAIMARL